MSNKPAAPRRGYGAQVTTDPPHNGRTPAVVEAEQAAREHREAVTTIRGDYSPFHRYRKAGR